MPYTPPRVSVIVPCRNEADCIAACLACILGQEEPPGGFEVIVADGMSDDGTRRILRRVADEHPRVRVIDNPGLSVSCGLNAAIRAARGEIVIRMDAHTQYATDYVQSCVAVLEETRADNVGGPWIAMGAGRLGSAIAAAFGSPFAMGMNRGRDPSYEGAVETVYLGCWRRELFDSVGLFDEQLVRNQDDEFNLRLTLAGARIWQSPRIRSRYQPRQRLGALWRQYMQYGYWKVRVMQKHRRAASVRHVVPALFVLWLVVFGIASLWAPLARTALASAAVAYALFVLSATVVSGLKVEWRVAALLPLVFACYHLSYGYGSLKGLMDVVFGYRPAASVTRLTRGAVPRSDRTRSDIDARVHSAGLARETRSTVRPGRQMGSS